LDCLCNKVRLKLGRKQVKSSSLEEEKARCAVDQVATCVATKRHQSNKSMSEQTDRAKELVEEAYGLAQRSRTLRLQVKKLAKKAARLREAKKKVQDGLGRNGTIHKPSAQ